MKIEYSRFGFTTCSPCWCKTPENRLVHKIFRVNFISTTVSNFWKTFVSKAQQTPRQMWLTSFVYFTGVSGVQHMKRNMFKHTQRQYWCIDDVPLAKNKTKQNKTAQNQVCQDNTSERNRERWKIILYPN